MGMASKKREWPKFVRSGAATVKVYRRTRLSDDGKADQFTIYFCLSGKEHRIYRNSLKEAMALAKEKAQEIERGEVDTITLAGADCAAYRSARKMLDGEQLDFETAVRDFLEAYKLVKPMPLVQVAQAYREQILRPVQHRKAEDVVAELLASKKTRSPRHVQTLRNDLARFARVFGQRLIASIRSAEIESWLDSIAGNPRTRFNIFRSVMNLFNFAKRREYVARQILTEADYVDRAKYQDGEIHRPRVFSPHEMEKLLNGCPLRLVPLVVLAAFCGVRREEIMRLHWSDVFGTEAGTIGGHVTVWADQAKTKRRRIPPLLPNAAAWLKPFRNSTGLVCPCPDRFIQLTALARKLGLTWSHNVLRDSFISHRVAATQNIGQVALEAGNSPAVIQESYLELVAKSQGVKYFRVSPPKGWQRKVGAKNTAD